MSVDHLGAWVTPTCFEFFQEIPTAPGMRAVDFGTMFSMYGDLDLEPIIKGLAEGTVHFQYMPPAPGPEDDLYFQ